MKFAALPVTVAAFVAIARFGASAFAADAADADLIKQGQYLATAGDCAACHTAPGGKPFAGGLPLPTPVGAIISTNITPSKTNGIGKYTLQQFDDALRRGVRAGGERLYPAMPYTSYAQASDDDVKALYAYFMKAVTPVDTSPSETSLPFPFNTRLLMAGWNLLFLGSKPFAPDPDKGADWNRGAYLVRGLTHCSTCHSPRNLLMAEESSRDLAGGDVGDWFAPNITSDVNSGIGGWSEQDLVDYLRTGHAAGKAQAAGPMAEAVDDSLRYLSDADLKAIATYLTTVPAVHDNADTQPAFAWGAPADDFVKIRGVAPPTDPNQMSGPQIYDAYCATCHQSSGQGSPDGALPSLFHNATLGSPNTNNFVMAILDGVHRPADAPTLLMPGFASELSDGQIATLSTYLLQRFGNPQTQVTVKQVSALRAGSTSSFQVVTARAAMVVAAMFVVVVAFFIFRHRRRSAVS